MFRFFKKLKKEYSFDEKDNFLKGAYWGLLTLCLVIFGMAGYFFRTGLSPWLQVAAYLVIGVLAFNLFRWFGAIAHSIFKSISGRFISLLLAVFASITLASELRFSWPGAVYQKSIFIGIVCMILVGSGIYMTLRSKSGKVFYLFFVIAGLGITYYALRPILDTGKDPFPIEVSDFYPSLSRSFDLPDPSLKGSFEIEYFTYGSGTDERRIEYGEDVKFKTETVNALPLLPEWTGKKKRWRERYWGFGIEEAPINGRVWMPKTDQKSPLILIVHGNHGMEHHSDPGYAYLGELLASRGFITVSVDENYINGTWSGDFRGREMPARAWLLLKHLEQWRNWSEDANSSLFDKADLDNVILMGHSRGGEAVSIAAAYNQLSHFPDDASVKFDFNFGIKGIVAIAPTDARYFRRIELKDLNYLSIQGTYDADEASFFGLRQYQRVSISESTDHFKAGILVHKANHGQFNSIWGRRDFGVPFGWFLNTGALLNGEDQRQSAKVFLSAFAERTFNQANYDPIFEQPYLVKDWLPSTPVLSNYTRANNHVLIDFENDIDLTSDLNVDVSAENFLVWREQELEMRDGDTQGTNAVILGWDNDSLKTPVFELTLKDSIQLNGFHEVIFSVGRDDNGDLDLKGDEPIDFKVELITSNGTIPLSNLSEFKRVAPLLKVQYMKLRGMNGGFGNQWELNMETAALPFNITTDNDVWLKQLRIHFDQSPKGIIALDNIGLRSAIRFLAK